MHLPGCCSSTSGVRAYVRMVEAAVDALGDLVGTPNGRGIIGNSHLVVLVGSSPNSSLTSRTSIVTKPVFKMVWEKHFKTKADWAGELCSLLILTMLTPPAARWSLESRVHQLLTKGRIIHVSRIRDRREHAIELRLLRIRGQGQAGTKAS